MKQSKDILGKGVPIVQTLDSAIHRINLYPKDKYEGNELLYALDSVVDLGKSTTWFVCTKKKKKLVVTTLQQDKNFSFGHAHSGKN